ncbi:helix-turn-helix domain-containing protein [Streptomyces griseorubiginosus]|uniref:TetR/AcrR family transcriptional regulator n=1 Tax=Streptomyces griseorubiginosus TaxID=67304 RepID=UPI002E7FE585|nr:helix-turn-helix domain-containing protein [Streptomyces griseorubiginosus]WUB42578.1 TetR/AcrR family transcriptional regulator [Streptomyces griseorubiginosus]WUB51096.1 TetR/AcrR family transcriptional regulator [Streptomyces griseorubiginosus]
MTSPPADQTLSPQTGRGLRADAERNRCRILAAARHLFATEGLGVSMASVAREAGVGKATLGRRFANRDELVNAVFADRMDAYVDAVTEALADPDPWRGFTGYLHAVCAMQAADRGFADVLAMTFPAAKALEARRAEAYNRMLELITRAKDTGHLREDFTHQDVVILLIANAGVVTATGEAAPDTWRRLVGHMIRSFATPDAPIPPLPEAPAPTALYRAMVRLSHAAQDSDVEP